MVGSFLLCSNGRLLMDDTIGAPWRQGPRCCNKPCGEPIGDRMERQLFVDNWSNYFASYCLGYDIRLHFGWSVCFLQKRIHPTADAQNRPYKRGLPEFRLAGDGRPNVVFQFVVCILQFSGQLCLMCSCCPAARAGQQLAEDRAACLFLCLGDLEYIRDYLLLENYDTNTPCFLCACN